MKKNGRIFTPEPVVKLLIDGCGYVPGHNVIDNSCGNGAILKAIVEMIIESFHGDDIIWELENHVHGIEIDPATHAECIENLNAVLRKHGIDTEVNWDIHCGDALQNHTYDQNMNFVICNPPYIRTRDLDIDLNGYDFVSEGMKDLYLAFFELGFRQLWEWGRMVYITPSSWFTSAAAAHMRDYIINRGNLVEVYDFGHNQVFSDAQAYVAISIFYQRPKRESMISFNEAHSDGRAIKFGNSLWVPYEKMVIDGKFYFGADNDLNKLKDILNSEKCTEIVAKNGYATLCDEAFIGDFNGEHSIPVIKASTGNGRRCFYPYSENGKLLNESDLNGADFEKINLKKDKLLKRSTDEPWYAFGRTQAIGDTYRNKFTVKNIVKSGKDFGIVDAPSGTGVYGGIYVIADTPEHLEFAKSLFDEEFFDYVKMLRKYKSGGYYAFSTNDFNCYAAYKLNTADANRTRAKIKN